MTRLTYSIIAMLANVRNMHSYQITLNLPFCIKKSTLKKNQIKLFGRMIGHYGFNATLLNVNVR